MKFRGFIFLSLIILFAGCDTMYHGIIDVKPIATLENDRTKRALEIFKQFALKYDYTLQISESKGNEAMIHADAVKRGNPHITLRISSEMFYIQISSIGGWWPPPKFDNYCNELLILYQKEYGQDKVKLIKE